MLSDLFYKELLEKSIENGFWVLDAGCWLLVVPKRKSHQRDWVVGTGALLHEDPL